MNSDPLAEYANMPDAFEGRWFTPKELRRKNRELAKMGRRICRTHQEAALPLTEEYFYHADKERGWFDTECKCCKKKRAHRHTTWRRLHDTEFAEHLLRLKRESYHRRKDAINRERRRRARELGYARLLRISA